MLIPVPHLDINVSSFVGNESKLQICSLQEKKEGGAHNWKAEFHKTALKAQFIFLINKKNVDFPAFFFFLLNGGNEQEFALAGREPNCFGF